MATTVRLDDEFVAEAKTNAAASMRSVPKQIEHWAKIGRIVEDNPELPFSFIQESLLAIEEVKAERVNKYVRRTTRD